MGSGTLLALSLTRSKTVLRPDPSRVLLRQFDPGDARRMSGIIRRVLAVPEPEIATLLEKVWADFSSVTATCNSAFWIASNNSVDWCLQAPILQTNESY